MTALFLAVLAASLLGSMHCAGMCGAFVAIACGAIGGGGERRCAAFWPQGAYHAGRLISYAALGAAAGATGSLVNVAGRLAGLQATAVVLAGAAVASFGLVALLRACGLGVARLPLPAGWTRRVSQLSGWAMNRPPLLRAGLIGLLTTLLPCGWLYAFAVTAAGTAQPVRGALVMTAFWAGTLPALAAVGLGARKLAGPLGRKLPVMTALAMVVVGGWMLAGRSRLDPVALAGRVESAGSASHAATCCSETP
jgi:sulfite exporter TauE/SafE